MLAYANSGNGEFYIIYAVFSITFHREIPRIPQFSLQQYSQLKTAGRGTWVVPSVNYPVFLKKPWASMHHESLLSRNTWSHGQERRMVLTSNILGNHDLCSLVGDLLWVAFYFLIHFHIHKHFVKRVVEATSESAFVAGNKFICQPLQRVHCLKWQCSSSYGQVLW